MWGMGGTQTPGRGLPVGLRSHKTFGFLGYPRDFRGVVGVRRKGCPSSGAGNSRVSSRYNECFFKCKCVGFSSPCDQRDPGMARNGQGMDRLTQSQGSGGRCGCQSASPEKGAFSFPKAVNGKDLAVHKCIYLWLRAKWAGGWVSSRLTLRFRGVTLAHRGHQEDPERGYDFIRTCSST